MESTSVECLFSGTRPAGGDAKCYVEHLIRLEMYRALVFAGALSLVGAVAPIAGFRPPAVPLWTQVKHGKRLTS